MPGKSAFCSRHAVACAFLAVIASAVLVVVFGFIAAPSDRSAAAFWWLGLMVLYLVTVLAGSAALGVFWAVRIARRRAGERSEESQAGGRSAE